MATFSNDSPPYVDSPSAGVGQSMLNRAATFPVSGKECGALPRRRYTRKVLKLSPGRASPNGIIIIKKTKGQTNN
jgi:hypothetical protein